MNNYPLEAIAIIHNVLQVGSKKHKPGAWREESVRHHVGKAHKHLVEYLFHFEEENYDGEDTLAHALTRLAMAVAVRSQDGKTNPDK